MTGIPVAQQSYMINHSVTLFSIQPPDTTGMFEEFSGGYYLGRLYVQPGTREYPAIQRRHHEQANARVYEDESSDTPLVMKLDTTHFPVRGEADVPEGTLVLPESVLETTSVRNPPELSEVFLAKAGHAKRLLRMAARRGSGRSAAE